MPRPNAAGSVSASERYGSSPNVVASQKVAYMASIISEPWAKLMIFITPKISVSPSATRA